MTEALLIGFALGWLGSMPVAGAVSIFIVQHGLSGRIRDGLRLAAGAGIAEALWCIGTRMGAAQILARFPGVRTWAEVVGGLVLLGLGVYFLRRRDPLVVPAGGLDERPAQGNFRLGFFLVAGNPSIPVHWLALIAMVHSLGFDLFGGPPGTFALGVALGIFGWFSLLLLALDRFRVLLPKRTMQRVIKGVGAVLVVMGIGVLVKILALANVF